MLLRVLLLLESKALRRRLRRFLGTRDLHVSVAEPGPSTWGRLARESYDLILTSATDLPDPPADYIAVLRAPPGHAEILVIVDEDDGEERAGWLAAGALEVVSRCLPDETLGRTLGALIGRRRETLLSEVGAAQSQLVSRLGDFVTHSVAMEQLMELARRVASADTSLLVTGETGVGKEWLARAIHAEGPRAGGPFVAVNCAALPEGLLESELFGHVEGAFTGAIRARRGYFELAHGGTLFLDEVGEIPLALQAKLLRALQERTIQPIGGEESFEVDVRIIAASNRDLEVAVQEGSFRSDLYYRLGVVTLTVPPLRERRDDIPVLVDTYLQRFSIQLGRPVDGLSLDAMQALIEYDWPGNVRELINVMERGVLLCRGHRLGVADLPDGLHAQRASNGAGPGPLRDPEAWMGRPLHEARAELVEVFEREYLARTLERCEGRVGDAADRAGIDPRTLYNKMRQYGLEKERFRN
ncbi:MAG: sigma-54 interaction domain-containing protein [Gemmatimonadota bacterium]